MTVALFFLPLEQPYPRILFLWEVLGAPNHPTLFTLFSTSFILCTYYHSVLHLIMYPSLSSLHPVIPSLGLVREVGGRWEEGQKWKNRKDVTSFVTLKKKKFVWWQQSPCPYHCQRPTFISINILKSKLKLDVSH